MVFPVVGGTQDTGYEISNSLRFNYVDSANLQFTPSSAGTEETFTISAWIKKSMNSANSGTGGQDCYLFSSEVDSNNRTVMGVFGSSGTQGIFFENKVSGTSSYVDSAATFRDPSAWMHCVWAIDTTQSTDTNRVKLYVNGSQISSFDSTSYLSQNTVTQWSRAQVNYIGSRAGGNYYDGYLSEVHVIDGQQLAPTEFGETNDNGVWIPKQYTGSYGTNGYKLEFKQTGTSANSSGMGADTSGNDNHFSVSNLAATDVTTDTPTNNFATMNPLANFYAEHTFSEGNCKIVTENSANHYSYSTSTMGVANGKWYAEFKASAKSGGNDWFSVGVAEAMGTASNLTLGRDTGHTSSDEAGQIGWLGYGTDFVYQNDAYYSGSTSDYDTDAYGVGDILSVALDADNNRVYFYKNGTIQNSGTHFNIGVSPTGFWHFAVGDFDNQNYTWECNFGNAPFSISSGNADANGYGNFEYAVPSGYYALCTKNLAEYG